MPWNVRAHIYRLYECGIIGIWFGVRDYRASTARFVIYVMCRQALHSLNALSGTERLITTRQSE